MGANETSKLIWNYQAAAGAETFDDASDAAFEFGLYNEETGKWATFGNDNPQQPYYTYAKRTPTGIISLNRVNKTFKIMFLPTTAQHLVWMLKQVNATSEYDTICLETGLPLPLTIRLEFLEGTIPRLLQAIDCYCVSLFVRMMSGSQVVVETEWAYGRLEDYRGEFKYKDIVSASDGTDITMTNISLTTNEAAGWYMFVRDRTDQDELLLIASNTNASPPVITLNAASSIDATTNIILFDKKRPFLTSTIYGAGNESGSEECILAYDGRPDVDWDHGAANIDLDECWKAAFKCEQDYKVVMDANGLYGTVYLYKHKTINITLNCIFETGKQWTDYLDQEERDLEITVWKPDMTNYIKYIFTNAKVVNVIETGIKYEGLYEAIVVLQAEKVEGAFLWEGTGTYATHFKVVA